MYNPEGWHWWLDDPWHGPDWNETTGQCLWFREADQQFYNSEGRVQDTRRGHYSRCRSEPYPSQPARENEVTTDEEEHSDSQSGQPISSWSKKRFNRWVQDHVREEDMIALANVMPVCQTYLNWVKIQ